MHHPLDFLPLNLRKPLFWVFLALTVILSIVMQLVDKPLGLPQGIISFEFAATPQKASTMVNSWDDDARIHAGFSLGIDYLYMPAYSLALALGILLAMGKHSGWMKSIGAAAGWGAFAAATFDAAENYALFHVLLGEYSSPYPQIAAVCATAKFALIFLGIIYALIAWLLPKRIPA